MEEQLISLKTAKLAKEIGFNLETEEYFSEETKVTSVSYGDYSAPTQSLLQKWLRQIHDILVYVEPRSHHYFQYHIITENDEIISSFRIKDWEKVLEKGLQEALKLIKK